MKSLSKQAPVRNAHGIAGPAMEGRGDQIIPQIFPTFWFLERNYYWDISKVGSAMQLWKNQR